MNNYFNTQNNEFYKQVSNNLDLQKKLENINKKTLVKTMSNWFNTINIGTDFVKRQNNDLKSIKTDFDRSQLNKNFIRNNKIAKAMNTCLLSGYQKQRAFCGNYEDVIREYKNKKNQDKDFVKAMICFEQFCYLFNHGFICDFEQTRFGVDVGKLITNFEQSFENLTNKQKEIVRKYVNEILCSILIFNALDRKNGNVLIDENGKINLIDFDDLPLNKGKILKKDQFADCLFSDLGNHYNAGCAIKSAYKNLDKDGKSKLLTPRKYRYTDYHDFFNKYGFQVNKEMMETIDSMLKIDENMIRAMFVNIKSVVPDCSFEEAKRHILKKLTNLIAYRHNLINDLSTDCVKKNGRCTNVHDCIIAPKKIVNKEIVQELRKKLRDNITEVEKCKNFLNNYKEQDFDKDFESAVKLYNIKKKKDIGFSVGNKLSNTSKKTNLFK
ncbi:MAG: hypothetical protein IJT14_02860 [Rickettsiales bacterium]|nr:hypothetical protein [Rickettsiales bacterium]